VASAFRPNTLELPCTRPRSPPKRLRREGGPVAWLTRYRSLGIYEMICNVVQEASRMGLIWDLIQHSQISETQGKTESLERRVAMLEEQVKRTNDTLVKLLRALETRFGDDLDGDGRVG
jgi:hypothetical protein